MDYKKLLVSLKKESWHSASLSFFVVKRHLVQHNAKYEVLHVDVDKSLAKRLRDVVVQKINVANQASEYAYNTSDQDGDLLGMSTAETDLHQIIERIQTKEGEPPPAKDYEQIIGAWMYIARLDISGKAPLYAVRRVSGGWTAKKVKGLINMLFQNHMLVDLKHEEIFRVDNQIDFYSYKGGIFIANKKNFEAVLNFREGMIKNRDVVARELVNLGIFQNEDVLKELIGDNMKRLRRLSQVKNSGYYKDKDYLNKLRAVNKTDNWGLNFAEDGKMVATEETIDIILKVLNNDRLSSKVNNENFDVDVKYKV